MTGKQVRNRGNPMLGKKFGFLTVMNRLTNLKSGSPNLRARVVCDCACGSRIIIPIYYLTRKQPAPRTDCGPGCTASASIPNPKPKVLAAHSYNPEYRIYNGMIFRCTDPTSIGYEEYSQLGIAPEWSDPKGGFDKFFAHMGKMPSPFHSIDRIDNAVGYFPGNVRWATAKEQAANRRTPAEKALAKKIATARSASALRESGLVGRESGLVGEESGRE